MLWTIWMGIIKMFYMCVRDLAQKLEKYVMLFELRARSMSQVKRVDDLNQDPRANKNCPRDSNQPFSWFE